MNCHFDLKIIGATVQIVCCFTETYFMQVQAKPWGRHISGVTEFQLSPRCSFSNHHADWLAGLTILNSIYLD